MFEIKVNVFMHYVQIYGDYGHEEQYYTVQFCCNNRIYCFWIMNEDYFIDFC